jgi:hypothetical protein
VRVTSSHSASILTENSTIGQGLDQRTEQILTEIRQLRIDLPQEDSLILQRFLDETETYAESIRESSTTTDGVAAETVHNANSQFASSEDITIPQEGYPLYTELEARKISTLSDIDKPNEMGQTALHIACQGSDRNLISKLLEDGASLTARDHEGLTALEYASLEGYHLIITLILDFEYIPRQRINGASELHRAAYLGNLSTLSYMFRQPDPPDVNVKDDRGLTPLHVACQSAHEDVVIFLLTYGADCKLPSRT